MTRNDSSSTAIEVTVPDDDVDLVSGLLWGAGVSAVAEHAGVPTVLRTDVPAGGLAAVRAVLDGRWPAVAVKIADDGLDAWRAHARAVAVGRRLVIRPPWVEAPAETGDRLVVDIDPGRAFGHGAHPTTVLCLEAVDAALDRWPAATVADVGCGSGVVAVAAARLGAAAVTAVDIAAEAVEATRANAVRNEVAAIVEVSLSDDPTRPLDGRGPFDVVVANIGAAALAGMADHLAAVARRTLILSGVLDPPPADLLDRWAGLGTVTVSGRDGWAAVTVER